MLDWNIDKNTPLSGGPFMISPHVKMSFVLSSGVRAAPAGEGRAALGLAARGYLDYSEK
jgi:hypothetical protein